MTPIYVVCKQTKNNMGNIQFIPDSGFVDYPSAFAYAQKIFVKDYLSPDMGPRDLVFMLNVAFPAPTTPIAPIKTTSQN